MKLRLLCKLLLVSFAIQANADNLGYSAKKPLVFGIDKDYPPLEYVDAKGNPSGVDVDFTKRLMERLNIPMTYKPNAWTQITGDVIGGKVDLGMMVFSPYRKDSVNYSRAVIRLYYQMITRKGEKKSYGLRDINGMQVALMHSRPVVDTLKKSGANVILVNDLTKAFKELAAGQYDAVISYRYQARYMLQKYKLSNLEAEDLTLTPREYCYVSQNKQLIKAINRELDVMEDEDEIRNIYGNVATRLDGVIIPQWVYYVIALAVVGVLLTIILMQKRNQQKLKKALDLARENEQKAHESEEKAKASAEIARKNEEKAKANEEAARKSEELKDIFMGNMSHSLRTPLNAIIGFSDLLMSMEDGALPREERDNLLHLINKNGLDLLHLVNELLSLGDLEGKSQLFQREVTDIDYEMGQYAAEIRLQLKDGVTLEVEEPVEGLRALVDKKLMKVVTMHLLDNAMQHTKEGKITLTYYVKEGGMYVEVRDSGEGLPEKFKDNIFGLLSDKNTYTHDESQENPGLGLSVCKAIIDRCNGKIGARENNVDGKGALFWYWVPTEILI